MPFFEIIGVVSTWKNFNIAGAFLAHENEESYVWAIEQLEKLFILVEREPICLVTDREKALMNAIDHIFPKAKVHLCRRHIRTNIDDYAKKRVGHERGKIFSSACMSLFREEFEPEYDAHLRKLELNWEKHPQLVQYLKRSWLNPYKERIVSVWTNSYFSLGTTTTNRLVNCVIS